MILRNFNRNYHYNSKHNMDKIRKIVKKLMEDETNPKYADFLFRYNTRNYPKTSHEEFELPGDFKQIEDTAVFVIDNGALQMDYAESITPNGKMVKRDAANNLEHQKGKLNENKIETIFDYCLYSTIQHKKPVYSIVATDHDYGKEYIDYVIEGFVHRIYFRIFNKEKLYKLLNTVCKKDYSQEELSNSDYMKIINCIIFAKKPYAQDIIEKCAYLFALIENIKLNHQLDLHLALKMGIKNHFQKNNKKMEELLTVITKAINKTKIDELGGYEVKQYTIEELETKLLQKEKENQKTQEKLLQKLLQKEKEIKKLQQILQKNNITI